MTNSPSPGDAGVRARNESGGMAIAAEGDLFVTGAFRGDIGPDGGASFPRSAWDSGWMTINQNQHLTLVHGIGGNANNYVVDLQFWSSVYGIHHINHGTSRDRDGRWGWKIRLARLRPPRHGWSASCR